MILSKENHDGGIHSMFSAIRKRMTYANVAMTLVLMFAMTGGAYAAKKYLITSTKQISPTVIKQLQSKVGPVGPAGAQGPQGAVGEKGASGANGKDGLPGVKGDAGSQGPEGKEGPAGKEGKTGPAGQEGKEGKAGLEGKEGSPWTAGGTLPSGKTETGMYAIGRAAAPVSGTGEAKFAALSFNIPLAAAPEHVHYVHKEEVSEKTAPAECPGSFEKPEATLGSLCAYEQSAEKTLGGGFISHTQFGAIFIILVEPEGFAVGTWAVTAA